MLLSLPQASLDIKCEGAEIRKQGQNIKYKGGLTTLLKKAFLA